MWKRIAAVALAASLAACAGLEPVGRNAGRSPAPTPTAQPSPPPRVTAPPPTAPAAVTPPPAQSQVTPAPAPRVEAPPVVAPQVSAPPPPRQTAARDDEIVVPGQRDTQVPPPNGDPRSRSERVRDIRAWDQCVSAAQAVYEDDPMRPQLDSPEDVCRRQLGMADRDAVPITRRQPRR